MTCLVSAVLPMSSIPWPTPVQLYDSQGPLCTRCFMCFRILAFFLRRPDSLFFLQESVLSNPPKAPPTPHPPPPSLSAQMSHAARAFCAPLLPGPTLVYEALCCMFVLPMTPHAPEEPHPSCNPGPIMWSALYKWDSIAPTALKRVKHKEGSYACK